MTFNYLIKPSLSTKFRIDFSWWDTSRDDLQVYLLTHLTQEQQRQIEDCDTEVLYDYVDPRTGEVTQLDAMALALRESALSADFISERIGLIDSIFRALLVNDNQPLDAEELARITGRDAATILKTIGGVRVYRGIRPFQPDAGREA